ncbi:ATP-binding protein [Winogradskyella ursingii]|uniref:ATP-binding protein n=1 Tax=Winogradskyella ursingii TaxID=2686079 RepID=UPI0015CB76D2|nr:ATP-binding protein [Winogradskyella ursingii]
MELEKYGTKVDDIPVHISYRIIELFSAGLYSSPNKAFEELVSNSYDAMASKVAVYIPQNSLEEDEVMWVCDNGHSMNKSGLKDLWMIGRSSKTNAEQDERPYIGQFGIGKLATYILTYRLIYICKTAEGFYSVEMDYRNIKDDTEEISLDEIELTEESAKELLTPYLKDGSRELMPFSLFGEGAEESWTFTIMTSLKPKVAEIKEGRLKWILSTALPLNPNFTLYFNGDKIDSSKTHKEPLKVWTFGEEDKIVAKNSEYTSGKDDYGFYVDLPNLKGVRGQLELYDDSLVKGKSELWGRSNGIFLSIRKRLINIDDPLLGMAAMTHGVFNRSRIIVEADGLNKFITSTRESIKDSTALSELKKYIQRKFSEAREFYFNKLDEEELLNRASYKIAHAAGSMSRRPLLIAAKKFFAGDISSLILTDIPEKLTVEEKNQIIQRLEEDLTSEEGIIKDVEWIALKPEEPIAKFDLLTGIARINLMHPFFANFVEDLKSPLPFQLFALTEILTEVALVEQGVSEVDIKEIIYRRDNILRELTFSDKQNAPAVANLIKATLDDPDGLEDSLTRSFAALGFETTPIGGNGKPDGLASAYLEHKNSEENYKITFDAKSTKKDKIMASTAHISGVDRHREDYGADYAVVVAIGFQGADNEDSAVNKEAKKLKVNLITASDLINLILLAGPKQLGLKQLRPLFENCHTTIETSKWINDLKDVEVDTGPIKEVLNATYDLMKDDTERPDISSIRAKLKYDYGIEDISKEKVSQIIQTLEILVPNYISIENSNLVSLQNTPEIILKALNQHSNDSMIPFEFRQMYLDAYNHQVES